MSMEGEDRAEMMAISESSRSRARYVIRAIIANKLTLAGIITIGLFLVMAVFADLIATRGPLEPKASLGFSSPSLEAYFGTDRLGRDIYSRVVHSSRVSLIIPLFSVIFAITVGGSLALITAYFGGVWDNVSGRLMDIIFGFPFMLFVIAVAAMLGPGIRNTVFALGIVFTPLLYRVVRGPVLVEKEKEYVNAASALGASNMRIMIRHIAPNVAPPVIIQASVTFAGAILIEAAVSFLGLGTPAENPSWGRLLSDARDVLEKAPWASIFPGIAIMLAVLAFNMLGDGLRDILDPRLRQQLGGGRGVSEQSEG